MIGTQSKTLDHPAFSHVSWCAVEMDTVDGQTSTHIPIYFCLIHLMLVRSHSSFSTGSRNSLFSFVIIMIVHHCWNKDDSPHHCCCGCVYWESSHHCWNEYSGRCCCCCCRNLLGVKLRCLCPFFGTTCVGIVIVAIVVVPALPRHEGTRSSLYTETDLLSLSHCWCCCSSYHSSHCCCSYHSSHCW